MKACDMDRHAAPAMTTEQWVSELYNNAAQIQEQQDSPPSTPPQKLMNSLRCGAADAFYLHQFFNRCLLDRFDRSEMR